MTLAENEIDPELDPTRHANLVMYYAARSLDHEWAAWHPGDGTQYRVKLVPQIGGPNHGDYVLLVSVTDTLVAVPFTRTEPGYRHRPWNATRWANSGLNPSKGYDWWPKVIEPLLRNYGAVS